MLYLSQIKVCIFLYFFIMLKLVQNATFILCWVQVYYKYHNNWLTGSVFTVKILNLNNQSVYV